METKLIRQKINQLIAANHLPDIKYEIINSKDKPLKIKFDGRHLSVDQTDATSRKLESNFGGCMNVYVSSRLKGKRLETVELENSKPGSFWYGTAKEPLSAVEKYFISNNLKYTKPDWGMYLVELEDNFYYYWEHCYKWRPKGTSKMKYSKGIADFVSKIRKLNPESIKPKAPPILKKAL